MPQEGGADAAAAELSVHDVILELLGNDDALSETAKDVVLNALAEVSGGAGETAQTGPAATFLSSISVSGFRGVGPSARLDLYPAPGLMVVSGRNGSGKSSFAEALELTLTGTSYRWYNKKESLWSEAWQNLHHPDPCEIEVGFTREAADPFSVGVRWDRDAKLEHCTTWTKTGTGKRVDGTDTLGWSRALELHRPLLSYEELGRLFDGGPSALYDALAKLLGLDALADTEKILTARHKTIKSASDAADAERRRVQNALAGHPDERAGRAAKLLRKRVVPLDDVRALATGARETKSDVAPASVSWPSWRHRASTPSKRPPGNCVPPRKPPPTLRPPRSTSRVNASTCCAPRCASTTRAVTPTALCVRRAASTLPGRPPPRTPSPAVRSCWTNTAPQHSNSKPHG
ncbi:hypothetical protein BN970_01513 [Mycolicibacterium conceptionense]|uniref:Nuclease SbcCD subunit C n=1 Tax=Mycolicibacterium conceptionense TaxID=451644 RepID=A0A0U1D5Y4_9MYCO|nr:hypothetical protein BN970_01513 [Mycolicibacterium conceptionense]